MTTDDSFEGDEVLEKEDSEDEDDENNHGDDEKHEKEEVSISSQKPGGDVELNINSNNIEVNTKHNEINMKEETNNNLIISSVEDLTDENLKQVCATDVRALLEEEIKKANEKFSEEKLEKENALAEIEAAKQELEAKFAELISNFEKSQAELSELKTQIANREMDDVFQARISSIDEEFSLTDEESAVIAEQIKELDEEAFDKWYKAFNIFAKRKSKSEEVEVNKTVSAEQEVVEVAASVEENSAEEVAEAEIEKAEAAESEIPNGTSQEETLRDRFAKAFNSNTIKIQ